MRNVLWVVVVSVLVAGLTVTAAFAEKKLDVAPVQQLVATPVTMGPLGNQTVCQVGNLNPAYYAISNFVSAPEDYKLAFDPMATCSVCPIGFKVNKVHAYLQVTAATTIVLSVDVEEVVYPTPGCTAPGAQVCASVLYQVNLPSAGMYNVGIPITCGCLTTARKYMLSVHFQSHTRVPALITDAGPGELCFNWNDYGPGWYDMVEEYGESWPGQLKFFADAECCEPPVPVEGRSWGAIKELYE
jgi:hypothetical protein